MKLLRVLGVIACCILLMEFGLAFRAFSARRKAAQMLQVVDAFRLGRTSKTEAEAQFAQIGLKSEDEACSTSAVPCQGFAVLQTNYPGATMTGLMLPVTYVASHLSLYRPTSLVGNFYFISGHMGWMEVGLSTEKAAIGMRLASTALDEGDGVKWQHNYHNGGDTFVRTLDLAKGQSVSISSSEALNLNCFKSLSGCNTNGQLWSMRPDL